MKKLRLAVLLAIVGLPGSAVYQLHATPTLYDSFNYPTVGTRISLQPSTPWVLDSGTTDPKIASGSLSYPGLQTAAGDNSVVLDGTGANGVSRISLGTVFNINTAPTVYYSLTFKVTTVAAGDWTTGANWTGGSYMMGLDQKNVNSLAAGDAAAPLLIRTGDPLNTGGNATSFQGYQLGTGVTATSGAGRIFDSSHVYNLGDTLFLMLSYTFGAGAADDVAKLWVNPIPGSAEGANTPVVNATGATDVTGSQISAFFLRNNSVEPTDPQIDDLRIGTTWEDVTPVVIVPEPGTAMLAGLGALILLCWQRKGRR